MTQSLKASKAFIEEYKDKIINTDKEAVNQAILYWWNNNQERFKGAKLLRLRDYVYLMLNLD